MKKNKEDDFSLFSKYDKIGIVLLLIFGTIFFYDNSPMLSHLFSGDFFNMNQETLLPKYLEIPMMLLGFTGLFLVLRMFNNCRCCP